MSDRNITTDQLNPINGIQRPTTRQLFDSWIHTPHPRPDARALLHHIKGSCAKFAGFPQTSHTISSMIIRPTFFFSFLSWCTRLGEVELRYQKELTQFPELRILTKFPSTRVLSGCVLTNSNTASCLLVYSYRPSRLIQLLSEIVTFSQEFIHLPIIACVSHICTLHPAPAQKPSLICLYIRIFRVNCSMTALYRDSHKWWKCAELKVSLRPSSGKHLQFHPYGTGLVGFCNCFSFRKDGVGKSEN